MMCNLPKWAHERDKFGNIVRKAEYRTTDSPPICVPGDRLARRLDAPFNPKAAFGRRVA